MYYLRHFPQHIRRRGTWNQSEETSGIVLVDQCIQCCLKMQEAVEMTSKGKTVANSQERIGASWMNVPKKRLIRRNRRHEL